MMSGSVPPSRPPDNVPSRSDDRSRPDPKKPFNMPRKNPPGGQGQGQQKAEEAKNDEMAAIKKKLAEEEKEDKKLAQEKKKGEGLSAYEQAIQAKTQMGEEAKGAEAVKSLSAVAAKEGTQKIAALILKMVEKMQIGTVGGQTVASMELKATSDVPSFFANSTLTLIKTDQGIVINFNKFDTPLNERLAINAVESGKNELALLVNNLAALNIKIANFQIGNHTIEIPSVPPPTATIQTESSTFRERREGGGGGGGGQEQEPGEKK